MTAIPPASVGVKTPESVPKMMKPGKVRTSSPSRSARGLSAAFTIMLLRGNPPRMPLTMTTVAQARPSRSPGTTPFKNSRRTETSATAAQSTMMTEGGMIGPMIDPAVTKAAAKALL